MSEAKHSSTQCAVEAATTLLFIGEHSDLQLSQKSTGSSVQGIVHGIEEKYRVLQC